MILRVLRRLLSALSVRFRFRTRPNPALSFSVALCGIPEGYKYIHVEWHEAPTLAHGWIVNFGPGVASSIDPCYADADPLDAIAARFDAAVDAAAKGLKCPPRA